MTPNPYAAGENGLNAAGAQAPKRRLPWWAWLLICLGGLTLLTCSGVIGFVIYAGTGPDTKVYVGNEVPAEYTAAAKRLGVLEDGEKLFFFYSDAFHDVSDGMYLVTDRAVGLYKSKWSEPARRLPFERIVDAKLDTETSFFSDSTITLTLDDGSIVSFPVSHERKLDVLFLKQITSQIAGGKLKAEQE
jgi:hypothetical protein